MYGNYHITLLDMLPIITLVVVVLGVILRQAYKDTHPTVPTMGITGEYQGAHVYNITPMYSNVHYMEDYVDTVKQCPDMLIIGTMGTIWEGK